VTRARTTAILGAVAAVLSLWWILVERPKMFQVVYPGRLFYYLLREDIQSVEIEKPGQTVLLVRGEGGRWRLEKPVSYPAATGPVDTLLSGIVFLEATTFLEDAEGAFPDTGPRFTVRFLAQGETHTIEVGNRHIAEPLEYYRVGEKLFLADENLKLYCQRSVFDWRDKAVCPLSPDSVGRVEIAGRDRTVQLERSSRGIWFMREPQVARADANLVEGLIDGLNTLAVKEFFNDHGQDNLATYGLDDPAWRVRVVAVGGEESYEVLIGAAIADTDPAQIYVKRQDLIPVFRCEDTATVHLEKELRELRDSRVLPFADYGWVRKIDVRSPSRDFSLLRATEQGNWSGINRKGEPGEFPSSKDRGGLLVKDVASLTVGAYRPGVTIGAERFRFTVFVEGLADPMEVVIGDNATVDGEPAEHRYLARRKGVPAEEDVPFELFSVVPQRIEKYGYLPYRALELVEPIPAPQFIHFELVKGDRKWLLLDFGTSRGRDWVVEGYREAPLDQEIVQKAVAVIRTPTAQFFEPDPAEGLAALGLTRVRCRLAVRLHQGMGAFPFEWLYVGKRVDPAQARSYGKLDTLPIVFIFDPTALFELAEHLEEVCKPGESPGPK
jgi:hypothetical protein